MLKRRGLARRPACDEYVAINANTIINEGISRSALVEDYVEEFIGIGEARLNTDERLFTLEVNLHLNQLQSTPEFILHFRH